MRILSAFPVLALLCANVIAFGQSMTLTGHVTRINKSYDEAASCGCAVGDPVSAVIYLQTYFVADKAAHRPQISIYQLTRIPEDSELKLPKDSEDIFMGNSFKLQIGSHVWINRFRVDDPELQHKLAGQLQLSRPVYEGSSTTFTSLFSTGFWVKRLIEPGEAPASKFESVSLDIDSRPDALWNTTGDPIPPFSVMDQNTAPILKGGSFMSLRSGFQTVAIMIDKIAAEPLATAQIDITTPSIKAQIKQRESELHDKSLSSSPPPNPPNPPSGFSRAAQMALYKTTPFAACLGAMEISKAVMQNLTLVPEGAAFLEQLELPRAEVVGSLLMLGTATTCINTIVQAMASHGKEERRLQSGGQNTVSKSTADQLNKRFGKNLMPRDWGRALEALKKSLNLPNSFHGNILSNGDYVDNNTGEVYGNLDDFIP